MQPDNVTIGEFDFNCHCGSKLKSLDGDRVVLPLEEHFQGIGWSIWHWECEKCGVVQSLSLGVVSDPIDDEVAFDEYHESQFKQFVTLQYGDINIKGREEFDVKHKNPLADYQPRVYRVLSDYNIGPFDCKRKLRDIAQKIAPVLIERTQITLANANSSSKAE